MIPPLANGDGGNITAVLNDLCYQYTYDARKRMMEKKLPGVGWTYLVYDLRDRLVATQDPEMRTANPANGRWLITKYDQLNRPVMTASKVLGDDRATLQTYFDTYPSYNSYYETRDASVVGYTMGDSFYPKLSLSESDLLTVTYYDTYGYPGVKTFDNSVRVSDYYNSATGYYYFNQTKGQVTGSRVKVLDGTENNPSGYRWLVSTNYYDDRYRVVQTLRDLFSPYTSDNEVASILYDFIGKVLKTQARQVFYGNTNTVTETSIYDQAGRLKQVKHQVNSGTEVTLASMEYDEVGQLKQKSLNGEVGSGIQNLNYFYNIRGWLEKINNPDVNPSSTSLQKLNLGLYYNNVPSGLSANTQFNGNISGLVWNTPEQSGALSPADKQGYGFTYDGLNRMKASSYGEGSTFAVNANANNENLTYDKNGNITALTRYRKGDGVTTVNRLIDNLTYTYKNSGTSNMLDQVDDAVAGAEGFSEYVKQANEYAFDGNGNLIKDDNKAYNSILYNYLNLPKRVGTTSQYISYVYDAAGTKLAKINTGGAYTYYAGSFVYSGSSLNYIIHREGMYLPGGNYQYYLKDHLGNTRLVVNTLGTGGEIVQQTDYYPFGMDIANYNYGNANKYRYNGKEFQNDLINGKNLDWYDYGARFYDPQIGRFHTPDRFAEKYLDFAPYHYAANNPIRFIDINGDSISASKAFLDNKLTSSALFAILSSKEGMSYFAKYAAKGDKITIGSKTFSFDTNGEYSKKGIDLSFDVGALPNYSSGVTKNEESPTDNGLNIGIVIDTKRTKDAFNTAEAIIHEGFLEANYLAKDFSKDGRLNYDNISGFVRDIWLKGDVSNYNHGQNLMDRKKYGGENLLWPGTGYRVLQDVNKTLKSGLNNQQIQGVMSGFVGFYGKLFGKN